MLVFDKRIFGAVVSVFAGVLLFLFAQPGRDTMSPEHRALYRAVDYLWKQQGGDGGWHSGTHAILQSGESLTPFILNALLDVPPDVFRAHPHRVRDAYAFLRKSVYDRINADSTPRILDYPNYSAAYALRVFHRSAAEEDTVLVRYLTEYLISQQFTMQRGIDTLHPAFGGWGFGETNLEPGTTGHVDISHTRRVLQALRLVLPADHVAFANALHYLRRVQNFSVAPEPTEWHDGGFYTSVVTPETNKSQKIPGVDAWESYATATCDGLLGLLASGIPEDDLRVSLAARWLLRHSNYTYPEGIPPDDPMGWHLVMKYYHLAVRGEICNAGFCIEGSGKAIAEILLHDQRRDGSFINQMGGPNKEDDPLLCTAFAIIAMSNVMDCPVYQPGYLLNCTG